MKLLIGVKVVPALERVRYQPGINRIVREDADLLVNEPDLHAVAAAQGLRHDERDEVVLVTMGPPEIAGALQSLCASGVDRVVHLCDPCFAGADTLATARALAQVYRREQPDLFVFGRGTTDGGTAQTPAQVAEILGLAHASGIVELELAGSAVRVVRELERCQEHRELLLPAVVSVEPCFGRPAGAADGAAAAVELWDADRLGGDSAGYGIRGSRTYVQRVEEMAVTRATQVTDCAEAVDIVERAYRSALAGIADFPPRSTSRSPAGAAIWVLAERDGDRLHPVSFEGIACAAQVSERLGAEIVSVLPAEEPDSRAYELAARGADRVLVVTAPELASAPGDTLVAMLSALVAERRPLAVIAPWSSQGRDYLPRVAARLEMGLTGDFVGLDVAARPGDDAALDLVWLKPAWAGTGLARVVARSATSMGTLRPGAVRRLPVRDAGGVPVEALPFPGVARSSGDALLGTSPLQGSAGDPVDTALVVLCVGGSVEPSTVARLEELVQGLPWAVAGTTSAVARGLVPSQRELSVVRRSIAPPVFVGLELDGPQDLQSVRTAGVVMSVGSHPGAPFTDQVDATVHEACDAFVAALGAAVPDWQQVATRT